MVPWQTSTEDEAAAALLAAAEGRLPVVSSYALDIPKKGTLKRKKFDDEVAQAGARINASWK